MESMTPEQVGVSREDAERIMASESMQQGELSDESQALADACWVLAEARGRYKKLSFPLAGDSQKKALTSLVENLLAATEWPLKKISRAGEEWIVDTSTPEYETRWRPFDK